jgi:uncharacterized protein YjbI with pentapeptide repeats
MPYVTLTTLSGKTLYQGHHPTLCHAVEFACERNLNLDGIDLSYSNLTSLNLDGVKIKGANFQGANLTGSNLTESVFYNCNFEYSVMTDACLCYSDFSQCNFKYSHWAGVDLAETSLENSSFSGFSTFLASFAKAHKLERLTYKHADKSYVFSRPPTYLKTDNHEVAFLDNVMIYKGIPHTFDYKTPPQEMDKKLLSHIQSMVDF